MRLEPMERAVLEAVEAIEDGLERAATATEVLGAASAAPHGHPAKIRPASVTVAELEAAGLIDDVGAGYRLSALGSSTLFDARSPNRR